MKSKLVKTISGNLESKENCRKIDNEYYKIGDVKVKDSGDVYKINDRYYKENTGYIIYDHLCKEYQIKSTTIHKKGVVFVEKDKLEIGYFTQTPLTAIVEYNGSTKTAMNYSLFDNSEFKINKRTGVFVHYSEIHLMDYINYRNVDYEYKRSLDYNANRNNIEHTKTLHTKFSKFLPTYDYSKPLSRYLDGLSFGVEFETTKGTIPKYHSMINSLIPLRDGSIKGLEYVTTPLSGETGINTLMNATKLIDKYTTFDNTCALHVHIGNIPRTESFILALFKVMCLIEDDMYKMFPLYKNVNGGYKKKNYTSRLPAASLLAKMDRKIDSKNIKDNFSVLFEYLSNGISYSEFDRDLSKVHSHPYDPDNNRKWNVRSR